jgi:EF-P beta-lysylation protein EpmB
VSWSDELKHALDDPGRLLAMLDLDPDYARIDTDPAFPLRVPLAYIKRMRKGDFHDPLLRQVLPLAEERHIVPGFVSDPLQERSATLTPGVIQKYAHRALLIVTGVCAVHCRYCFRREFPYADHRLPIASSSLRAIESDPGLHEIILSGGDPLMLSDEHLGRLVEALDAIGHLRRLRIHTRLPVVIPARVTNQLVDCLRVSRLRISVVVHVNHANELEGDLETALRRCAEAGIALLNQSVLLKGVNDSVDAMCDLSERLFDCTVLPYYIHLPDAVRGTHHFAVPDHVGRKIIDAMRIRLPGYLVPRLVKETPGEASKTWL